MDLARRHPVLMTIGVALVGLLLSAGLYVRSHPAYNPLVARDVRAYDLLRMSEQSPSADQVPRRFRKHYAGILAERRALADVKQALKEAYARHAPLRCVSAVEQRDLTRLRDRWRALSVSNGKEFERVAGVPPYVGSIEKRPLGKLCGA